MTVDTVWPKVAVVGAGAVGGYFGGLLARAGVPVTLIGRRSFVEAVRKSGFRVDAVQFQETLHPEVSDELSSVGDADIVLFCVKSTATRATATEIARHLKPGAVVVSLQNGVNNAEEIRDASGIDALPCVVYVAASVPEPGHVKHLGRGDLVIGPPNPRTEGLGAFLNRAGVPCRISDNIEGELWTKLVWNCALNAVSGLGKVTYGEIIASADAKRVVAMVVDEVLAVAHAKHIRPVGLDDPKIALAGAFKIAEQMSGTRSSTAQDMARGKLTEIDALNGHVAKLGAQLGVPTPVNYTLYTLVKLYESTFG